jgi:predicted ATPase
MLRSARLVTITGPGGVGKTRLATSLAHELEASFAEGSVIRDVAQYPDGGALGAHLAALRGQAALLVLDTCDHLLVDCAARVADLLHSSSEMVVLATSRAALGVPGERRWPLAPLRSRFQPAAWWTSPTATPALMSLSTCAASPSFVLNEHNALHVQVICERLDGLPPRWSRLRRARHRLAWPSSDPAARWTPPAQRCDPHPPSTPSLLAASMH